MVRVVESEPENLKITTADRPAASPSCCSSERDAVTPRPGSAMTATASRAGRRLVLGGVELEHDRGLAGHSDADVLTHAIIDALLGAAALGDIGEHFPDTDERYRDADSLELLRTTVDAARASAA